MEIRIRFIDNICFKILSSSVSIMKPKLNQCSVDQIGNKISNLMSKFQVALSFCILLYDFWFNGEQTWRFECTFVFSIFYFCIFLYFFYMIYDQEVSKLEVALFTETRLLARLQKNLIADNHEEREAFFAANTVSLLGTRTRTP